MPEQVCQLHIQGFEFGLGRFDTFRLRYIFYTLDIELSDFFWVLYSCKSLKYLDIGVHDDKLKHLSISRPQLYDNILVLRIRGATSLIGTLLDPPNDAPSYRTFRVKFRFDHKYVHITITGKYDAQIVFGKMFTYGSARGKYGPLVRYDGSRIMPQVIPSCFSVEEACDVFY